MSIESIKHKKDKRSFIPSKEEAGTESANPKVKKKESAEYPKNPVVHRGQDPELFWMNKYGADDTEDKFRVDIRSLYRTEHISPEVLIKNFYKLGQNEIDKEQIDMFQMFGNDLVKDEIAKVSEYYKHQNDWSNRMILGDSLLVMNSLLEREGMSGKVQMIYFDPPYGIKYGGNWQMKLRDKKIPTSDTDEYLSGEPEQIKAYRDTWELGIHSYLSYLRDRLLVAKDLLTESGSCFLQISDENAHLVRALMDEVFHSENFVATITYQTAANQRSNTIQRLFDNIIWYAKSIENLKVRKLFRERTDIEEKKVFSRTDENGVKYKADDIDNLDALQVNRLKSQGRLSLDGKHAKLYNSDFPVTAFHNVWTDTVFGHAKQFEKVYVVQTNKKVIERCVLLSTDPGDLIVDPTCGSGTTAFIAEQWGRRWVTIDTSRIAINIAKTRLLTSTYPYYKLHDEVNKDIRQGFEYEKVPHITLTSLANDEPAEEETLFDQPFTDSKKLRVAGPFTVETLQNYDPVSPEDLDKYYDKDDRFIETVFEHLKTAGVKNGIKNEQAVFTRVEPLSSPYLNAEGFYMTKKGESKAYFHIGPKFGTVSKQVFNEAIKECRNKGDADWLIILGFSFESDIENKSETTSLGTFEVTKARMHDDLMQEGLLKKDKKAASFVTIGEPDIEVIQLYPIQKEGLVMETVESAPYLVGKNKEKPKKKDIYSNPKTTERVAIEICGLDIYDPIKDEVKSRDINDIAYWMLDDDYDGNNFMVRQVFFCGGEKDEYDKMKKNLEKLQKTLKVEIDEEAFERVYSHKSHPIEVKHSDQKIAVKVVSQFGEESMKVVSANYKL